MSLSRVCRSPAKAVMSYSRTDSMDVQQLPLVDCPFCGKRVIRLQNKKPTTYGAFFKCEENEQDDPTSYEFYKWEKDYRKWLAANFLEYVDVPSKEEQKHKFVTLHL